MNYLIKNDLTKCDVYYVNTCYFLVSCLAFVNEKVDTKGDVSTNLFYAN